MTTHALSDGDSLARWIRVPAEAPETWDAFQWPEWIPDHLRQQIQDFWSASYGRGPRDWLRDHVIQGMPDTGETITTEDLCTRERDKSGRPPNITGRYVHAWNNVGRIVLDDGRSQFACARYRPRVAPLASVANSPIVSEGSEGSE